MSLIFFAHFDILCDLSFYRAMAIWNLFVLIKEEAKTIVVTAYTKSAFVGGLI